MERVEFLQLNPTLIVIKINFCRFAEVLIGVMHIPCEILHMRQIKLVRCGRKTEFMLEQFYHAIALIYAYFFSKCRCDAWCAERRL